jgi:hypothetical protein
MAIRFYDEAIKNKIESWVQDTKIRVLKPDEVTRLFRLREDQTDDENLKLPLIAISRETSVTINSTVKQTMSFDGYPIIGGEKKTLVLNAVPITVNYQIDIFTKRFEEGDEYLRNFIFQLINNPKLTISIPYNSLVLAKNNIVLQHIAYLKLLDTVTDNSDISEKLFADQFTRWTLQLELEDGYLFSVPYNTNWSISDVSLDVGTKDTSGEIVFTEEPIVKS